MARKATDTSRGGRPWLAGGPAMGMASRCPVSSATRCTGLDSSLKRIEQARSSAFRQVTRSVRRPRQSMNVARDRFTTSWIPPRGRKRSRCPCSQRLE